MESLHTHFPFFCMIGSTSDRLFGFKILSKGQYYPIKANIVRDKANFVGYFLICPLPPHTRQVSQTRLQQSVRGTCDARQISQSIQIFFQCPHLTFFRFNNLRHLRDAKLIRQLASAVDRCSILLPLQLHPMMPSLPAAVAAVFSAAKSTPLPTLLLLLPLSLTALPTALPQLPYQIFYYFIFI